MAIKTAAEWVEEYQTAISKVLLGQEAALDGKRVVYADLGKLERGLQFWLAQYRADSNSGPSVSTGIIAR